MDGLAVAQALAGALLGSLPVLALEDAFRVGIKGGLLGAAGVTLVLVGRGAAPALVTAAGGIRLLLLFVLAGLAGAMTTRPRRARCSQASRPAIGAPGAAPQGNLVPYARRRLVSLEDRQRLP